MELNEKIDELAARVAFLERVVALRLGDGETGDGTSRAEGNVSAAVMHFSSSQNEPEEPSGYEQLCRLRRECGELLRL